MFQKLALIATVAAVITACAGQQGGTRGYYGGNYEPYDNRYVGGGNYDQYGGGRHGGSVNFSYFHDELAPHGQWYYHPRWGDVWRPSRVGGEFRPYYERGYWRNTVEFGWTWVSDYEWGHIPFHYGRWVNDPFDGWIWIPGYVWAPSWVVWRSGGGYLGWFPMPPTNSFLLGVEVYDNRWDNWDQGFGYANWYGPQYGAAWSASLWVFVDNRHFGDRDFQRWSAPRDRVVNIVQNTTNVTNYVTVNNYIVNRSVDTDRVERESGRRFTATPAREVLRSEAPVAGIETGRQIQERERREHGGDPNASPRERLTALPPNGVRDPQMRRERDLQQEQFEPISEQDRPLQSPQEFDANVRQQQRDLLQRQERPLQSPQEFDANVRQQQRDPPQRQERPLQSPQEFDANLRQQQRDPLQRQRRPLQPPQTIDADVQQEEQDEVEQQ